MLSWKTWFSSLWPAAITAYSVFFEWIWSILCVASWRSTRHTTTDNNNSLVKDHNHIAITLLIGWVKVRRRRFFRFRHGHGTGMSAREMLGSPSPSPLPTGTAQRSPAPSRSAVPTQPLAASGLTGPIATKALSLRHVGRNHSVGEGLGSCCPRRHHLPCEPCTQDWVIHAVGCCCRVTSGTAPLDCVAGRCRVELWADLGFVAVCAVDDGVQHENETGNSRHNAHKDWTPLDVVRLRCVLQLGGLLC